MLRLVVNDISLDLYRDDPLTIKYQYTDLTEIAGSQSSFSQQFRLPLTGTNKDVFGLSNSLNAYTTFDPKVKIPATLFENSIPLLRGNLQVKNMIMQPSGMMDMEVVFFGETVGLAKAIGNGKLRDLSFSSLDRTMDPTGITDTWTGSDDVRFAIIDRGQNWQGQYTFLNEPNQVELFEPTGMVRVKAIMDEIMSTAGLTYDSGFFTAQDQMYMMANAGGQSNQFADVGEDVGFHIGLASNLTLGNVSPTKIVFGTSGVFYDQGGHISSGEFTVPYTGNYWFKFRIGCSTVGSGQTLFYLYLNNSQFSLIADISFGDIEGGQCLTFDIPYQTFQTGDVLEIRYQRTGGSSLVITGGNSLSCPVTSWNIQQIQLGGAAWDCNRNMPDMRQIDWLVAMQRAFNLVFIPDPFKEDHFQIETYDDYVRGGSTKDWTTRVALDKDIQVRPTTDLQASVYRYDMATGQDFISQAVSRARKGAPYGRYEITDPNNDFATGERTIKTAFASWITSLIPDTDFPILRLMNDGGEPLDKPLPRLAYWNGLQNLTPWYMGGVEYSEFPVFTEMSDYGTNVDPDTFDLNFGYERKFIPIPCNPRDTLFYKYYQPMVGSLYSSDARVMSCFLKLTTQDISTFEFSDTIVIKNESYRILDISYTANDTSAYAQVRFLRIVPSDRLCTYIPVSVDKAGLITFSTPTGGTLTTIPEGCCLAFGGKYDALNANCYGQDTLV